MTKTKTKTKKVYKLEACPFCGWKAKMHELNDKSEENRFWVQCTNKYSFHKGKCGTHPNTVLCKTAQTATRIWNKRSFPAAVAAVVPKGGKK